MTASPARWWSATHELRRIAEEERKMPGALQNTDVEQDRGIDILVIKTMSEIVNHITFEHDDLVVAQPALDHLRDAFKTVLSLQDDRATAIVRVLANTPPQDWLSKSEIHDALGAFRTSSASPKTICCYLGVRPTFRCPDCPHNTPVIVAEDGGGKS